MNTAWFSSPACCHDRISELGCIVIMKAKGSICEYHCLDRRSIQFLILNCTDGLVLQLLSGKLQKIFISRQSFVDLSAIILFLHYVRMADGERLSFLWHSGDEVIDHNSALFSQCSCCWHIKMVDPLLEIRELIEVSHVFLETNTVGLCLNCINEVDEYMFGTDKGDEVR